MSDQFEDAFDNIGAAYARETVRAAVGQAPLIDKPLPQIEWGHDLQKRLMAAAKGCDDDELANLLGEAASVLAVLTGRPA